MFGLLNVNKPRGLTSRDVVDQVLRYTQPAKVGHAGTLDPLATGVLVLCVGSATRLIQYVQQLPKRYQATFLLGLRSDTDDVDGLVEPLATPVIPTQREIEQTLPRFVGEIQQRPPNYSAVKVAGQRAYRRARRGESVQIAARPVTVFSIELRNYAYPQLRLEIVCGSGTYVRSIGRDLAQSLDTAAVMSALERTAIGDFHVADAICPEQLAAGSVSDLLLPATQAVVALPRIQLTRDEAASLAKGLVIERPGHGHQAEVVALDSSGRLAAIVLPKGPDWLRPLRNFKA